jgi:hypothetical protein
LAGAWALGIFSRAAIHLFAATWRAGAESGRHLSGGGLSLAEHRRVELRPGGARRLAPKRYAATLRWRSRGEGRRQLRPFHDGRHTSMTNAAAAGTSPAALMARAGHSDFKTTQGYIDLAGETFREEAVLLEERLFGQKSGQKSRAQRLA